MTRSGCGSRSGRRCGRAPDEPGDEAGQLKAGDLGDGGGAADGRHRARRCSGTARRGWPSRSRRMFSAARAALLIATGRQPGSGLPVWCGKKARSPMTNTSGWPGMVRSGSTHAPGAVEGDAEGCRQRGGGDAGGPEHGRARRGARPPSDDAVGVDAGDGGSGAHLDAAAAELLRGARRAPRGRRRARAGPPSTRMMRASRGSIARKSRRERGARSRRSRRPARRRWGRRRRSRRSAARGGAPASGSRSACSKASSTRRRISSASSSVLRPGAFASHSSWPK